MINAAVEKAMPIIDSKEIILMKFFFRLEKKYRLAMKRERFNGMRARLTVFIRLRALSGYSDS